MSQPSYKSLVLTLLLCGVAQLAVGQEQWQFQGVDRVVAVADIHGAYPAFETILQRADLIDDASSWSGGRTHLVIVGDVTDRGPDSRRALDLIRRLETEALAAGGQVHLVLGNHEIMNMMGDLRYVSSGEYAAFADDEPVDVRDAEFARYLAGRDQPADADVARAAFDEAYPVGFFAHRQAFSEDGEYGQWLSQKPVLVVVNGIAFVHGGLTASMIEQGESLNAELGSELREFLSIHRNAVDAGLLSRTVDIYALPLHIEVLLQPALEGESTVPAPMQPDLQRLIEIATGKLFLPDGPLWYRGNVGCNRLTEQHRLTDALNVVGAERLVVGHTPTQGAVVLSRMDETLLRIDTGMLNDYYGGRASALIIEGENLSVLYEDEMQAATPLIQPRRVGVRPGNASADELEALLTLAEVGASTPFDATATLLTLVYRDQEFQALFTAVRNESVNAAVAAYRLDRLLGLDMVPVTVERVIDGVKGALQFWPASAISERERSAQGLGASAWCPLNDQFKDLYLFDALIHNEARTLERIRYATDNFQLLLFGHDLTFATERRRPAYLDSVAVELTPAWRNALNGLDEQSLSNALGRTLDRRRIRALLARRDQLLELAE